MLIRPGQRCLSLPSLPLPLSIHISYEEQANGFGTSIRCLDFMFKGFAVLHGYSYSSYSKSLLSLNPIIIYIFTTEPLIDLKKTPNIYRRYPSRPSAPNSPYSTCLRLHPWSSRYPPRNGSSRLSPCLPRRASAYAGPSPVLEIDGYLWALEQDRPWGYRGKVAVQH